MSLPLPGIIYAYKGVFRYLLFSDLTRSSVFAALFCWAVQKRNAGYPGSSMICLSKMAARGTGFPPLYTMGFWDKDHHMRLAICERQPHLHRCTHEGVTTGIQYTDQVQYQTMKSSFVKPWYTRLSVKGFDWTPHLNSVIFHLKCCFAFLSTFDGQPIKWFRDVILV